ncbi:hypothetical protein BDV37DRAFT_243964 [Aspergillus pseudonomiae]|uniref:Secreted protein n=1 Tax=Aspergillus pseudonomiae TaxID=1506151 RepID=A0A5N7DI29_9EURO|nr:uncharacterized protein BDV37DRAFT_243964 [Aspergillus pseudonomiae]KAE8406077.1 hypothetical protein BDV37DRAFT_243964 [Aspergillus pseudonomiae]
MALILHPFFVLLRSIPHATSRSSCWNSVLLNQFFCASKPQERGSYHTSGLSSSRHKCKPFACPLWRDIMVNPIVRHPTLTYSNTTKQAKLYDAALPRFPLKSME